MKCPNKKQLSCLCLYLTDIENESDDLVAPCDESLIPTCTIPSAHQDQDTMVHLDHFTDPHISINMDNVGTVSKKSVRNSSTAVFMLLLNNWGVIEMFSISDITFPVQVRLSLFQEYLAIWTNISQ